MTHSLSILPSGLIARISNLSTREAQQALSGTNRRIRRVVLESIRNFFSTLPVEIIARISKFTKPNRRRALSGADRRIHTALLRTTRCIRIFSPRGERSPGIPDDILVKVISRYPKLNEINFGPRKYWNRGGNFFPAPHDAPYLNSLISYLRGHPLSSVGKIKVSVMKINSLFLEALGHGGLKIVHINAHPLASLFFTERDIEPLLNRSPDLTTLVLKGVRLKEEVAALSFASQRQLTKVKLLDWKGPSSTIKSLKSCERLKELVVESNVLIPQISLEEHPWDLNRLELKGFDLDADALDALTKKLPNLEWLKVKLQGCLETLDFLGRNCPKLKILEFSHKKLTNSGLDELTRGFPYLEVINLTRAIRITEEGVASLARNCNHLRVLLIASERRIEKSGIDALAENCTKLQIVGFESGFSILFKDLWHLVASLPELRHITANCYIWPEQVMQFHQQFPGVSGIPDRLLLNTEKLYRWAKKP